MESERSVMRVGNKCRIWQVQQK